MSNYIFWYYTSPCIRIFSSANGNEIVQFGMASLRMVGRAASSACDELLAMSRGTGTVGSGNIYSLLNAKIIDIQVQIYFKRQLYEDKIGMSRFLFSLSRVTIVSYRHRTVIDIFDQNFKIFYRKEIYLYFNRR